MLINQTGKQLSEYLLSKCIVALKHSLGSSLCGKEQYFQFWNCGYLLFLINSGDKQTDDTQTAK